MQKEDKDPLSMFEMFSYNITCNENRNMKYHKVWRTHQTRYRQVKLASMNGKRDERYDYLASRKKYIVA